MLKKSTQFADLLLPKELLKPIQELEDEYLGAFISRRGCCRDRQDRNEANTTGGFTEKELLAERKKIIKALSKPCGCGNNCQNQFTVNEILDAREDFRNMSWTEQHTFIIGKLQSFAHDSPESKSARTCNTRQRQRFDYRITANRPVCRNFFLLYYGESIDRLKRKQKYLLEAGTIPPVHGNAGKKPIHACSNDDIQAVLAFIANFASIHGLPDPGRDLRIGKGKVMIYLPSVMSYMAAHRIFRNSMEGSNSRIVEYHTFRRLWVENYPHIVFSKTKSDLCMSCEEYNKQINMAVATGTEEEKLEILEEAKNHLLAALKERNHYRRSMEIAKQSYDACENSESKIVPKVMHYSWDFAQKLQYPYEDHQVGPIYFKSPRTAQLFGVCCEALPRQVNYLIDEADFPGKGADTVISILDHFFSTYDLGEQHLLLTADNCVGQNKNNAVLNYLLYRTIKGLHQQIDWSFMLVGHTKFSPDAYFGLLRKKYRHSKIYTYNQLVDVINNSTIKGNNICHPYRNNEGRVSFKYRAWSKWLEKYFRRLPGISCYQHFSMKADNPGEVTVKKYADSPEEKHQLLKPNKCADLSQMELPKEITPEGLSAQRQWYLYDNIRMHIPNLEDKDMTAPLPEVERPTTKKFIVMQNKKLAGSKI
jgi:hypothetical protein